MVLVGADWRWVRTHVCVCECICVYVKINGYKKSNYLNLNLIRISISELESSPDLNKDSLFETTTRLNFYPNPIINGFGSGFGSDYSNLLTPLKKIHKDYGKH